VSDYPLSSLVPPAQLEAMGALARKTPPGAFAEIGVYRGGSAKVLYDIAQEQDRELHLFDTFKGIPFQTPGLDRHEVGNFAVEPGFEHVLREALPLAWIYVGTYPETHGDDLPPMAFVHVDCDQYTSYKAALTLMWPLLVPGGIMLFDDYPYLGGAKKAVEEHFAPSDLGLCLQRYYVTKGEGGKVGISTPVTRVHMPYHKPLGR
jgi:hypothetical protein